MKLRYFFALIITFQSLFFFGQQVKDSIKKERKVFFGGGIQLGVSNNYTSFGISPSVIYRISDKFSSGVGVSYIYSKNKIYNLKYNILGFSALSLYNPLKEIQLSMEFEEMHISLKNDSTTDTYWNPSLYLGAAYSMNRNMAIGIRYDILYKEDKSINDSPFTPFVRIYF